MAATPMLLLAIVLLAVAAPARASDVVPGEVIVRFSGESTAAQRARAVDAVGEVRERLPLAGTRVLAVSRGETPRQAAERLERLPGVEYAEPNARYAAASVPDDPAYPGQWSLPLIGAPAAWDLTLGHPDVMVAVVDTGVTAQHPDLAAAIDPRGRDLVEPGTPPLDPNGHGTHVASVIAARANDGFGMAGLTPRARILPVRGLDGSGSGDAVTLSEGLDYAARSGARIVNGSFGGGSPSQLMYETIEAHPGVLFVFAAGNGPDLPDDWPTLYPCSYELPNVICVTATGADDRRASFARSGHDVTDLGAPGVGIPGAMPRPVTPVQDDFEAALPGPWAEVRGWARVARARGGHALGGAPDADERHSLAAAIDLEGLGGCVLSYEVLEPDPTFDIRFGRPGSTESVTGLTSGQVGVHEIRLPALDGAAVLFFTSEWAEAVIDDVSVTCRDEAGATDRVEPLSGTSMAAPHVAGVAALAWARDLDAPVRLIRHRVVSTARPVAALRDSTKTGGVLDAGAAVASSAAPPAPAPFRIERAKGSLPWSTRGAIALLADGSVVAADPENHVVRRIRPDGTSTVDAGGAETEGLGDGGPATSARLRRPSDVAALPGGGYLIADTDNRRVRRVTPDGTIATFAGGGTADRPSGPATAVALESPIALAVDATGVVYLTESRQGTASRIRRIAGGTITTVAGDLDSRNPADDVAAEQAWIESGQALAPMPDGSVVFDDRYRLRRVTADGRVVAAADPRRGFAGDGGPLARARLGPIGDMAVLPDGTLLLSDMRAYRVRAVSPDGTIRTIAGRGRTWFGFRGDGGPAVAAQLGSPCSLAALPGGGVLVADAAAGLYRIVPDPTVRFTDVAPPVPAPYVEPEPEPEPDPTPTPEPTATPAPTAEPGVKETGTPGGSGDPAPAAAGPARPAAPAAPRPVARAARPVLRVLGRRRGRAFAVRTLDVRAPESTAIRLRCRGHGCPVKLASARGRGTRRIVFRAFAGRRLRGPLTITVDVGSGPARVRLTARIVRGRLMQRSG